MSISNAAPTDEITIYVDAARDDQIAGLGYVVRGEVSLSGQKYLEGHYTSMEAELHALLEAVRLASLESEHREYCEVYTDCKPLRDKIYSEKQDREDWEEYRQSAHWLLNKFDSWDVNYAPRSSNGEAHDLARQALFEGRGTE
jgi:ribonuclease HI